MAKRQIRAVWGPLLAMGIAFCLVMCDDDDEETEIKEEKVMLSRGIITASMNRYIESGGSSPIEQFGLMGMFARYDSDMSPAVESLLGSGITDPDLAMDSCTAPELVFDDVPRSYSDSETAIELLDVGNLTISFRSTAKPVPTRTFPDLLNVIVGVIYATDESKGVDFNPGATYTIKASGSDSVDRFRVALEAPHDLSSVAVNGVLAEEQEPVIGRGENVDLTWQAEGNGDEVIATFSWMSMGLPWSVTCRMRDDGEFTIPARITRRLPDPVTISDEELVIQRVRQMAFRSEGLSSGTFRFLVSTSFPVSL